MFVQFKDVNSLCSTVPPTILTDSLCAGFLSSKAHIPLDEERNDAPLPKFPFDLSLLPPLTSYLLHTQTEAHTVGTSQIKPDPGVNICR